MFRKLKRWWRSTSNSNMNNQKVFQLIKDLPSGIKAGGLYVKNSEGYYVDDFGTRFKAEDVENSPTYFKESTPPPTLPPAAPVETAPNPMEPRPLTEPREKPFELTRAFQPGESLTKAYDQPPQQYPQSNGAQQQPPQQPQQPTYWKPEPGDSFFWVKGDGQIGYEMFQNQPRYFHLYELHNVFRTQYEAQQACEQMKNIFGQMRTHFYGGIAPLNTNTMYGYNPSVPSYTPPQQQNTYYGKQSPFPADPMRANRENPAPPPAAFRAPNTTLEYEIPR